MTWHKSKRQRRDYAAEATELFARFAAKYDLTYIAAVDAPIEVLWRFPVQQRLRYPITLGLQNNDELNFGVVEFWSYFFPFTEKRDEFERLIDSWVEGRARIIPKLGFFIQAIELQVLAEDEWTTAYAAGSISFRKLGSVVLSNLADQKVAS